MRDGRTVEALYLLPAEEPKLHHPRLRTAAADRLAIKRRPAPQTARRREIEDHPHFPALGAQLLGRP